MHPKSISLGAIWGNDHMRSVKEFTVSSWEKTHHALRRRAVRAGEINTDGFSKITIFESSPNPTLLRQERDKNLLAVPTN